MNKQEQDSLKEGDHIILSKHIDSHGDVYAWNEDMDQYVGREATVKSIGIHYGKQRYAKVDIDGGEWVWFLDQQQLAGKTATRSSDPGGCKCTKCGDFVPYAEPPETFVCYSCRNRS